MILAAHVFDLQELISLWSRDIVIRSCDLVTLIQCYSFSFSLDALKTAAIINCTGFEHNIQPENWDENNFTLGNQVRQMVFENSIF